MKKILTFFILTLLSLICPFGIVHADNPAEAPAEFKSQFAGRYYTPTSEGMAVLELIPAFGRMFASIGYYMQDSLYSFYMAELIPNCSGNFIDCDYSFGHTSADVSVRFWSIMSYAGNYWPGETRQRLTLVPGGLVLSNYTGDGDALISKGTTLMNRDDSLPDSFIYGQDFVGMLSGVGEPIGIPQAVEGRWSASKQEDGHDITVQLALENDGTIWILKDEGSEMPPLLLKGISSVSLDEDTEILCYLTNSPASGGMPFDGCAGIRTENGALIFSRLARFEEDILLPDSAEEMRYERVIR